MALHHRTVLVEHDHIMVNDKLRGNIVCQHVNLAGGRHGRKQKVLLNCRRRVPLAVQQAPVGRPDFFKAELCAGLFGRRVDSAQVDKDTLFFPARRVYLYLVLGWVNGNV